MNPPISSKLGEPAGSVVYLNTRNPYPRPETHEDKEDLSLTAYFASVLDTEENH